MEQYNSIQQLMKKEQGSNKRIPLSPVTYFQSVFNGKTGASLEAVLAQFNAIYVQYQGSPQATRNVIPVEMRRAGLTITYMDMESNTITERASSAVQKDNDHWGLDVNWSRVDELSLSGDVSVSSKGTWIINGKDTGVKALGPKGDTGLTPWLKTIDNKLHFSYDNVTWEPCSENIAHWFRVEGNKLQISSDKATWETVSDYIAAYFRFNATSSDSQAGTIGRIQISRDNKIWTDLSPEFRNYLRIQGYVATTSALPANQVVGTIYGVGPTYAADDTAHTNPIYRLHVWNGTSWIDNGQFTSIAAGVVQETGDSETEVMSQKAVTAKLSELGQKFENGGLFKGIATLETMPEDSDVDVFYLAVQNGEYENFGGLKYEDSYLLNFLLWDSYNKRWTLSTAIPMFDNIENTHTPAKNSAVLKLFKDLKKNKYLSIDNGVGNQLVELYLEGLDEAKYYRLDYFGYYPSGNCATIRLYDASNDELVATATQSLPINKVVFCDEYNNSGIKGYAAVNIEITQSDNRISGSIINNKIVSDLNQNPIIKDSIFNPYILDKYVEVGSFIKELYIKGLDKTKEYFLKYLGYDPGTKADSAFITDESGNILATILDATRTNGIVSFNDNGHGIVGYMIKDFGVTDIDRRVTCKINVETVSNRLASPLINLSIPIVISKDGNGDYTSLTEGLNFACASYGRKVFVKDGVYDIIAEYKDLYGETFFTNYIHELDLDSYTRGIFLKNAVDIKFSSGAKIVCHNSEGNLLSREWFSPFNSGIYGFRIDGLNIECSNVRYCIHDERNQEGDSYYNHYASCSMHLNNANSGLSFRSCIGGGLGKYGNIIVESCRFKSEDLGEGRSIVNWHNTGADEGKSVIVVKNNYFYGKSSIYIHYYGTSKDISTMIATDNSFGIAPFPVASEGGASVVNVELLAWNNEIRS